MLVNAQISMVFVIFFLFFFVDVIDTASSSESFAFDNAIPMME